MNGTYLMETELIDGIDEAGLQQIIQCSGSCIKHYKRGQRIIKEDEKTDYFYLLLQGNVLIAKQYASGRRNIFCEIHKGEVFGLLVNRKKDETYWCDGIAVTDCYVFAMPWGFLSNMCSKVCRNHKQLIRNMLDIQSDISVSQMKKLHTLSGKTIEEKLAFLMLELMDGQGRVDFKMNREELSDYLGVARPSLSRTIGMLKNKGIITEDKSVLHIQSIERLEQICFK